MYRRGSQVSNIAACKSLVRCETKSTPYAFVRGRSLKTDLNRRLPYIYRPNANINRYTPNHPTVLRRTNRAILARFEKLRKAYVRLNFLFYRGESICLVSENQLSKIIAVYLTGVEQEYSKYVSLLTSYKLIYRS